MDNHFLGDGQNEGGRASATPTAGTSLAVRQFCAFAFGIVSPHSPSQPWRVGRLIFDERYCLGCFGVRGHDVFFEAFTPPPAPPHLITNGEGGRSVSYCRCCGEEVRYG